MKKIILASASPRREELMRQIGLDFSIQVAKGEEITTKTKPDEIVQELSYQKAKEVFEAGNKDKVVVGADTMVAAEGKILGKPQNAENCKEMLKLIQNRVHQVYTGVTIMWTSEDGNTKSSTFVSETKVYLTSISDGEIDKYMETGEPFDKAGGYGIQGIFAKFVDRIEGDYNNVVGLPISRLYQELRKLDLV